MSTKINDDSMSLEIDGWFIATAKFPEHAAADGHGAGIVSCHPGACSPGTRPSRPWCSRNGSPPATAMMTRSWSAGARSRACDRSADQDHDGARGGGRRGRRRSHLLPARLRTSALARRVRHDGPLLPFTVDGLSGPRPWWYWTPAAATSRYHGWPRGAWALGSWPRSAPTWRIASGTAQSAHWSARGPHWRWSARLSFLPGSSGCRATWHWSVLRRAFATHLAGAALVMLLIRSLTRANPPHVQHLAWRRRVVDHGSTRIIREDALFVPVLTPRERAADDADPYRARYRGGRGRDRTPVPACTTARARGTAGTDDCANPGADHPRTPRGGSQPARHSPGTQHRPP